MLGMGMKIDDVNLALGAERLTTKKYANASLTRVLLDGVIIGALYEDDIVSCADIAGSALNSHDYRKVADKFAEIYS